MASWTEGSWVSRSLESVPQFVLSGLRRGTQGFYSHPSSALPTVSKSGVTARGPRTELIAQASGMACSSHSPVSAVWPESLILPKNILIKLQAQSWGVR